MNNNRRAQGLIEFALVLPIFLFMVFVFIDLGRAIFTYSSLSNSVREGTRFAIVNPTNTPAAITAIQNIVLSRAGALDASLITVTVTPPTSSNRYVTIIATYPYRPITPGLSLILGSSGPINFRAQSSAMTAPLYWR